MSGSSVKIVTIQSGIDLVLFLANQWVKHKAESEGITVEEALQKATENYEAAQAENDDLKEAGHDA